MIVSGVAAGAAAAGLGSLKFEIPVDRAASAFGATEVCVPVVHPCWLWAREQRPPSILAI